MQFQVFLVSRFVTHDSQVSIQQLIVPVMQVDWKDLVPEVKGSPGSSVLWNRKFTSSIHYSSTSTSKHCSSDNFMSRNNPIHGHNIKKWSTSRLCRVLCWSTSSEWRSRHGALLRGIRVLAGYLIALCLYIQTIKRNIATGEIVLDRLNVVNYTFVKSDVLRTYQSN